METTQKSNPPHPTRASQENPAAQERTAGFFGVVAVGWGGLDAVRRKIVKLLAILPIKSGLESAKEILTWQHIQHLSD